MLHTVSQTLCKRTVPSLSLHSINVLLANLVSEKCSESVGCQDGRERKRAEEEINLVAKEKGDLYWFKVE